MWFCKKTPTIEKDLTNTELLRSKFMPHIKHSSPQDLHQIGEPLKCQDLKTNGACIHKTQNAVENCNSGLKVLLCRLSSPRRQGKSSSLKST